MDALFVSIGIVKFLYKLCNGALAEFILAAKPVLTELFFGDIVKRLIVKALCISNNTVRSRLTVFTPERLND